jgi:hypothetical protein
MAEKVKRKRGVPKGKQNAPKPGLPEKSLVPQGKKHGFYSKVLDEAEQLDFELASGVEGIDGEIALLRVKIKSLLESDPENIKLLMRATESLAKLVKTKYNISKEQKQGLKEAIGNVLRDIAIPLGIKVIGNLAK